MAVENSVPPKVLDELRFGTHGGIFIDETGSPGLDVGHLPQGRKSWAAVIVPRAQMAEVMQQLPQAIEELIELTGFNEFHFCPIYQGKKGKAVTSIPFERRLGVFRFMAYIFSTYRFPVLVQTLWPGNSVIEWFRERMSKNLGPFDLHDSSDLALVLLLLRVRQFLRQELNNQAVRLFIDEGRFRAGNRVALSGFDDAFAGPELISASSIDLEPLQLADFAAFALNRWQLLLGRPLNQRDSQLLDVLSPVVQNFKNVTRLEVPADQWPPVPEEELIRLLNDGF